MKIIRNSEIMELNGDALLYCKLFHHKPNMYDIMEPVLKMNIFLMLRL